MVPRLHIRLPLVGGLLLTLCVGTAMAQPDAIEGAIGPFIDAGPVAQALILITQTVLVGGLAITFAQNFTESVVDTVHHRVGMTVIIGIITFLVIGIAIAIVNISVISAGLGTMWAIVPTAGLLLVMSFFSAFGFLAIGHLIIEEWPHALGVGAVIAGLTAMIPFGGMITTAASVLGTGALLIEVVAER